MNEIQTKLKTRDFRNKYGVSAITIARWVKRGVLPKPEKVCGVCYWPPGTEPRSDGGDS